MHQELKELVYHAYLDLADDACTEVRKEMQGRGCSLPLATAALKSHEGFFIGETNVESIRSLTKRYQTECSALLDRALGQLGILQHESLVHLIRMRMQSAFGLRADAS